MTPISADDLEFDEAAGAINADELPFDLPDGPFNGLRTPPPPRPKTKPVKKPRQPIANPANYEVVPERAEVKFDQPGGFSWKNAGVKVETTSAGIRKIEKRKPVPPQGYRWEQVGGRSKLVLNTPRGDSFTPEGVTMTEVGMEAPRFEETGVQALPGETSRATLARDVEFQTQKGEKERIERAQRAEMRAKMLPKVSSEAAFYQSVGRGLGESFRQGAVGLSLLTGQEPVSPALQQPLPMMNEEQARDFWTGTLGQGVGSAIGFGTVGALTGPVGIALAGAAQNAGSTYEEARQRGVEHDEALEAAVGGALIGALEGIGGVGGVAKGFLKGTLGEIGQEVSSQLLNNVNAKIVSGYDPQRAISEGLLETAAVAGLLGGGAHGLGNLDEVRALPGQIDSKLRELGIEASFGDLDDAGKQAGVELYSGIDPTLIREYLPRPETIKSLFSSLFKGIKSQPDAALDKELESSRLRLFEQIANKKLEKMAEIPELPPLHKATQQEIDSVMDVPDLLERWDAKVDFGSMKDPEVARHYTVSYDFQDENRYSATLRHNETGEVIGKIDNPSSGAQLNGMMSLMAAEDSVNRYREGKGPWLPISEKFSDLYRDLATGKRRKAEQVVDAEVRLMEKHARRWLDKRKWEAERAAAKAGKGSRMEARTGSEPQGIVVHKVSAANLNRLLEEAGGDISQAQQPAPSIGVIHPETDFDSFGGIQLVATPSLIEDAVKAGQAYPTDFYTPTVADAIYRLGYSSITPENVQSIVNEMGRVGAKDMESRLSAPENVFNNAAIFNSYAKAGGAFESMEAVKEGLGALKPGARTQGNTPEFAETKGAQRGFNEARRGLKNALEDQLGNDYEGINSDTVSQIDQYLLTQLSKPTLPTAEQLEVGIRRIMEKAGLGDVLTKEGTPDRVIYGVYSKYGNKLGQGFTPEEAHQVAVSYAEKLDLDTEGWISQPTGTVEKGKPGLDKVIQDLAQQAAHAFTTFRNASTIYMEAQPPRGVRLDEYVAALVPRAGARPLGWESAGDAAMRDPVDSVADQLAAQGVKVYRYGSPEEKVAIQKALAQFKDLTVNPASSYGALYSNPVFDPEAWKRAKQAWLPGMPDPEQELLKAAEHVPGPPPPVEPPTGTGEQGPLPELFNEILKSDHIRDITSKVQQAAIKAGVELDPTLSQHMRVVKALNENPELIVANPEIRAAFEQGGITFEELKESYRVGISEGGRVLQASQGDMAYIRNQILKDPAKALRDLGKATFDPEAIKILKETELGMSLWYRMGAAESGLALTRMATLMANQWAATGQLALNMPMDAMAGVGHAFMNPEAYKRQGAESFTARAGKSLQASIRPQLEVIWSLPSRTMDTLLRRKQATGRTARNNIVLAELDYNHHQELSKLKSLEYANSQDPARRDVFNTLQQSMGKQRPARKQDRKVYDEWKELEARDRFNQRWYGKLVKGGENVIHTLLKPMVWAEMAVREPAMVGALDRALEAQGLSLDDMITSGRNRIQSADPAAVREAVRTALEVTWGYKPERANEDLARPEQIMESIGYGYIKFMNLLGPLNHPFGDLFARSFTNGIKFAWEWGPWGMVSPGSRIIRKLAQGDRNEITRFEAERISKAIMGTAMYATAYALMSSQPGDDEWYKLPTGMTDKAGKPISIDVRTYPQLALPMRAMDLLRRVEDGRMNDVKAWDELRKTFLQARNNRNGAQQANIFDETLKYWSSGEWNEQAWLKGQVPFGQLMALPVTPLQNLRDLVAQWDPEAAQLRDTAASPLIGPTLDKLPWLRNRLPLRQPFTEPAPQEMSARAGLIGPITNSLFPAIKTPAPLGFASREFARLGLKPTHFLAPDPDPAINRAQYAAYAELLEALSPSLENDPAYQQASAAEQAARWEQLMLGGGGRRGVAAVAKAAGEKANPTEIQLRKALEKGPGPLQNKASGLTKAVEEERRKAKGTP